MKFLLLYSPFGKGGWRGILRINDMVNYRKISPNPSFPKRGRDRKFQN